MQIVNKTKNRIQAKIVLTTYYNNRSKIIGKIPMNVKCNSYINYV